MDPAKTQRADTASPGKSGSPGSEESPQMTVPERPATDEASAHFGEREPGRITAAAKGRNVPDPLSPMLM